MIDLRYVGLTMIGIFLALAVGLMVGSALGSPDRLAAAMDGLRVQHEQLAQTNQEVREENASLERRLQSREEAERELLPLAVRERLRGTLPKKARDDRGRAGLLACDLEGVLLTAPCG